VDSGERRNLRVSGIPERFPQVNEMEKWTGHGEEGA
jgi:hypothetical protein